MTARRISLEFPLRGLSDDAAYSEQAPLTTREARNVRGIDPVTGRSRGGQRSGLEKFCTTDLGASHVQDIAVVTRDSPKIDYANLTTGNLTVEWSNVTPQEGATWWPEADFQGNVVILDGDNKLAKYNADGVLLRQTALLPPTNGSVVRKLAVDVDGGVYAAAYAEDYSSGALWRFVESETDPEGFELAWTYEFPRAGESNCAPVMFTQTGNTLYVVVRYAAGLVGYELWRLDGPVTALPTRGAQQEVPGPVNALEISVTGSVWLTADANSNRGEGPDTEGITRISRPSNLWTPHDLNNSDERLHFWTRADNIDGQSNATVTDGDEVERWEDHRFADASAASVHDTTDRYWRKDDNATAADRRHGPSYEATGWGGLQPCLAFDGTDDRDGGSALPGQSLETERNSAFAAKADAEDTQPNQPAAIIGATGSQYVMCWLIKIENPTSEATPFAFLSQFTNGGGGTPTNSLSYGFVGNAAWDTGSIAYSSGDFAMQLDNHAAGGAISGGTGDGTSGEQAAEGAYDATNGYALVTLIHYGRTETEGSELRINGVQLDSFTFDTDVCANPTAGAMSILGCRRKSENQNTGAEFWRDADGYVSFSGKIVEFISFWSDSSVGSTSGNTHDLNVPHAHAAPIGLAGLTADAALISQQAARYQPVGCSDVELVEGYIAHYWGVAHLLPHGDVDNAGAGDYAQNHPFGGTGNYPLSPGSTVDLAAHAEWSPHPVLVKYSGTGLSRIDAITGGGMGYSLATDDEGRCLVLGPWSNLAGGGTPYGPDNLDDSEVIGRTVADTISAIALDSASWGLIRFEGFVNLGAGSGGTLPDDGDQVVIDDGTNPAVTFEFDDDASVTVTATLRQVDMTGLGPSGVIDELISQIGSAPALDVTAAKAGPFSCLVYHDSTGPNNDAITVPVGSARIAVTGLQDGASATNTWRITDNADEPDTVGVRAAFDTEGDVWIPQLLSGEDETVTKLDKVDGSTLVEYDLDSAQSATGVALPLSQPSYIGSPSVTGPLFMYVTSTGGELDPQEDNLRLVRLVSETQNLAGSETPRATKFLAVVGGDVIEFTKGASTTDHSAASGNSLVATSPYIQSAVLFNKVVWCDGRGYLVYDAQEDTLEPLTATRGGTPPDNGRLVASWNGRLLIARTADDPFVVYGSRRGDITDWDEFPPVLDYLEAFSTPNSIAGRSPDIVNALIPQSDDLCLIGGDHTIYRLTGDPTGGGQFDLLSDTTGVAFGMPYCKDPAGTVYAFSSRGGVLRITSDGAVQRITRDRIERRMAEIDLSAFKMRMAYNYRDEGIHVWAVPYGAPTETPPVGWFLDKNGAWWEDSFVTTDVAPTAVAIGDGDEADDRVLLVGGGDGYVRAWSAAANSDDGERIDSYVTLGPVAPSKTGREFRGYRPQVTLAADQGGCHVEMFAGDSPESLGSRVGVADTGPGQGLRLPLRGRGGAFWVRLRNAAIGERWAYERGTISVAPAGRERVR